MADDRGELRRSARSALVFWGIAALGVAAIVVLDAGAQALLLAFLGVLLGTSLRGLAELIATTLHWRIGWSLAACILALLALLAGSLLFIVPQLGDQVTALADSLGVAYDRLREALAGSELGRRLVDKTAELGSELGGYATAAAGVLASIVGVLGATVVVVFVALYVAIAPAPYRSGVVRLVPPAYRPRARDVLDALARTLRRWMLGRIVSMTVVGVVTTIGLWILGIPLAIVLGLLSGTLGFIPNIGAIVSAVPAVLIAWTVSPLHALYVAILYVALNLADGYGLTPLLEKKSVSTPPALVIVAQLVFGALWGLLGLMLATPLIAVTMVLVRKLYVEDVLERRALVSAAAPPAATADPPA